MIYKKAIFMLIFTTTIFTSVNFKLIPSEETLAEVDLQSNIKSNEMKEIVNNEQIIDVEQISEKEKIVKNEEAANNEDMAENVVDSFNFEPLSKEVISRIEGVSWKNEAPVKLDDLSYVKVLYWGFDDKKHTGELIVHKKVAEEITQIFKELYEAKFAIEKMRLIDEYEANDDLSMADNNTSAFCFREVTGKKGTLSKHSYGIAIDINPVQNPYVKGDRISPEAGKEYIDRKNVRKGMIVKDDICYKAFKERGWIWGGEWKTLKDYQHFQKTIDLNKE